MKNLDFIYNRKSIRKFKERINTNNSKKRSLAKKKSRVRSGNATN